MTVKFPHGTLDQLWSDPENWRAYSLYVCKKDPRIIVPKRNKWAGWTINCARPSAWVWLFISLAFPIGLILYLGKSAITYWIIPFLAIYTVFNVAFSRFISSTDRYEENP